MRPGRFARAMTAAVLVFAAGNAAGSGDRTITTVDAAGLSSGDRAVFVPLPSPVRILDTRRPGQGPAIGHAATRSIPVTGANGVPADATAVVMNVTVVLPTQSGYLTVYPAGPSRPNVSSLNFAAKQTIPNLVTVKPGEGGKVSFFNSYGTSHVLADLAGYYVGHDHDDRYLPVGSAQARTAPNALTCTAGQYLQSVAQDGAPTCAADTTGPAYGAGFGIAIDGTTISAQQGRSATNAFTCAEGWLLRAIASDGAPTCDLDRMGPTYTGGFGVAIDGTTISAEQGRSAKNAFTCEEGWLLRAIASDGEPTCDLDQVGPTYTGGFGIAVNGTTISAQQGRSAAGAFTCAAGQYLRAVAADGTPTCNADQTGNTYTAGSGLTLTGTQFASAAGATVVPIRGDGTPEANGALLRSTITSLSGATAAKPYVVVAAPGTYALGTTVLNLPAYVSLVGSGRGQTLLTGSVPINSNGMVSLGEGGLLASLSVTNSTTGSIQTTAAVIVYNVSARIVDVAARATETTGNSYGIVVFSGGRAVIENSVVSAHNTTGGAVYGIYVVSSSTATIRNTQVSATGPGIVSGLETATSSTAEFVDGSVEGPVALKAGAGTTLRVASSKVAGSRSGTMTCFGTYDAAFAPVTC